MSDQNITEDNVSLDDSDLEGLNFEDLEIEDKDIITPPENESETNLDEKVAAKRDISFFSNIPVVLSLEVGSVDITLGELLKAGEGSLIELDKLNGEPLDVKVNGNLLGHAEVVVINDKYGLRLTDVVDTSALAGFGMES